MYKNTHLPLHSKKSTFNWDNQLWFVIKGSLDSYLHISGLSRSLLSSTRCTEFCAEENCKGYDIARKDEVTCSYMEEHGNKQTQKDRGIEKDLKTQGQCLLHVTIKIIN